MSAPGYTQAEIDYLIQVRKTVDWGAWNERQSNREGSPDSAVVEVASDDPAWQFRMEIMRNPGLDETHLVMKACGRGRERQAIVRYDIQDNAHGNPPWFPSAVVDVGQPHRHIYNERAIRAGLLWDACAEPVDISRPSPEFLFGAFWAFLNVHFTDQQTHTALFDWMNDERR